MYNPPTIREYPTIHPSLLKDYRDAYDLGYINSKNGMEYKEPHESSNCGREMTYNDELNYQYYTGFYDYKK